MNKRLQKLEQINTSDIFDFLNSRLKSIERTEDLNKRVQSLETRIDVVLSDYLKDKGIDTGRTTRIHLRAIRWVNKYLDDTKSLRLLAERHRLKPKGFAEKVLVCLPSKYREDFLVDLEDDCQRLRERKQCGEWRVWFQIILPHCLAAIAVGIWGLMTGFFGRRK